MTSDLRDLLQDAVSDAHPDLQSLTQGSRRRGLAIRRRRQALGVLGAAGVTALVLGGVQLLGPGEQQAPAVVPHAAATPSATPTPSPSTPASTRFTGRSTTAALRDAVAAIDPGLADHFAGQDPISRPGEVYAELRWHPADGTGFSVVGINVQPAFGETQIYRCTAWQTACSVTHPRRGETLMRYEERSDTVDGTGVRVVADLLRRDGVRVVASASNGLDLPSNRWRVTRPRPPFDTQDLVTVVTRDWFGPTMPGRFQQEGDRLPGYTNLSSDISAPSVTEAAKP